MAFLSERTTVVDCILTKKGRELLSQGSSNFIISKFALADDEVNYNLWDSNHPSGSDYYGYWITQTPVVEAATDESISMRYKLITLPKNTTSIPYIGVTPSSVTITMNQAAIIQPTTFNTQTGYNNNTLGYTAVLHDSRLANLTVEQTAPQGPSNPTIPGTFSWTQYTNSQTAVGLKFKVTGKNVTNIPSDERSTIVTVYGNETGGSIYLNLTVTLPVTSSVPEFGSGA